MALRQLIYVSTATYECRPDELEAILESAVRHNKDAGITGLLLYTRGTFMQLIEGDETAIDETLQRLRADRRHYGIFIMVDTPVDHRIFPSWSMGLRLLDAKKILEHPEYIPIMFDGFDAKKLGAVPGNALKLLQDFAER